MAEMAWRQRSAGTRTSLCRWAGEVALILFALLALSLIVMRRCLA